MFFFDFIMFTECLQEFIIYISSNGFVLFKSLISWYIIEKGIGPQRDRSPKRRASRLPKVVAVWQSKDCYWLMMTQIFWK